MLSLSARRCYLIGRRQLVPSPQVGWGARIDARWRSFSRCSIASTQTDMSPFARMRGEDRGAEDLAVAMREDFTGHRYAAPLARGRSRRTGSRPYRAASFGLGRVRFGRVRDKDKLEEDAE